MIINISTIMSSVFVFLCFLGAVFAGPPVVKSRSEIESFRAFLESTRTDNGVLLSERMLQYPKASVWENSGKYQGDILLDDEEVEAMIDDFVGRKALIRPGTTWPEDTIVYEFGQGEFDVDQQNAILRSIEEIEKNTCLKFRYREPSDTNFVRLTGRADGCYANVGYSATRGVHTMNLARNQPGLGCFRPTVIIHEWLHIVGMYHMQSTYNRDFYVQVMWENMASGMEHNFRMYGTDTVSNLGLPYEYNSNMHYNGYGFSINGQPTLVPFYDYLHEMGQQTYITTVDWLRVSRHYNCPGAWW